MTISPRLVGLVLALAVVATANAARADGDPSRGAQVFPQCQLCHSITRNQIGPRYVGLFGRRAGSVPDFAYSDALKNSGIVWSDKTLDQWLANPRAMVPGTKMSFVGISDPQKRADLIAYLKRATKPE